MDTELQQPHTQVVQAKSVNGSTSVLLSTFRDLPEELQLLVLQYALPTWSIYLSMFGCYSCTLASQERILGLQYVAYRKIHDPYGSRDDSSSRGRRTLNPPLFLVDRRMTKQAKLAAGRTFTGDMHLNYVIEAQHAKHDWSCACQNCESILLSKRQELEEVLKLITTVHCKGNGFAGFDADFLKLLPNLKNVITSQQSLLYDGTLYGFGNEEFFIQVLSEEKLKDLMRATLAEWEKSTVHNAKVKQLWQHGTRTVVEMTVTVGRTPTVFHFVTIFLLEENQDDAVPVLGKYSTKRWNESPRFRSDVYSKPA